MDKTKLTLMMLPLVALFVVPQAFALESGIPIFWMIQNLSQY